MYPGYTARGLTVAAPDGRWPKLARSHFIGSPAGQLWRYVGNTDFVSDGMNIGMLKRMDGALDKVRPVVQRIWNGERLEELDQDWRIEVSKSGNALLRLHSIRSGHFVDVYSDGIQEFREPGFLFVKDQFTITENGIVREPIADRRLLYNDSR